MIGDAAGPRPGQRYGQAVHAGGGLANYDLGPSRGQACHPALVAVVLATADGPLGARACRIRAEVESALTEAVSSCHRRPGSTET